MKMNLKLYFVFRGIIKDSKYYAMSRIVVPIINTLPADLKNKTTLYVGAVYNTKETFKIKNVHRAYHFIQRLSSLINHFILKLPSYKVYYFNEILYDYFLSLRIKKPVVLFSTAYLYRANKKNKRLGGINLLIAGNPDDIEINTILIKEQEKYNVYFEDAYTYKRRVKFWLKSLDTFDHIFTLNALQLDSFNKRIPSEKITCIDANIIPDKKRFEPIDCKKDENLVFCFVAHPFWLKGLPHLLEAWSRINGSNSKLRIGGRIDEHLKKVINERFKTLSNVEYFGEVIDMNAFLRSSHVCIIPSLLDAYPQTIPEAMYCGLPVIVSDGCGYKILVQEGFNGFVIAAGNSDAIADKINWFQKNRDKISIMGQEAIKTIENLAEIDQSEVTTRILQVVNEILKK